MNAPNYQPQPMTAARRRQITAALAAVPQPPWMWWSYGSDYMLTTQHSGKQVLLAAPYDRIEFRQEPDLLTPVGKLITDDEPNPVADWLRQSPAFVVDLLEENRRLRTRLLARERIERLGLQERTLRILTNAGITRVGQLLMRTEEELYQVWNMGQVSMADIKDRLHVVFDLTLRQDGAEAVEDLAHEMQGAVETEPQPTPADPDERAVHRATVTVLDTKDALYAATADVFTFVYQGWDKPIAYRFAHPQDCNHLPYGESCALDQYIQTTPSSIREDWPKEPGEYTARYQLVLDDPNKPEGAFHELIRFEPLT
jgi:hypothetical protein